MSEKKKLPATREQRMCQHLHNSLNGRLANAQQALQAVMQSPTTTPEAKASAAIVEADLQLLFDDMKWRVNTDGSTTRLQTWYKGKPYKSFMDTRRTDVFDEGATDV